MTHLDAKLSFDMWISECWFFQLLIL
jgi:hypothetical protein